MNQIILQMSNGNRVLTSIHMHMEDCRFSNGGYTEWTSQPLLSELRLWSRQPSITSFSTISHWEKMYHWLHPSISSERWNRQDLHVYLLEAGAITWQGCSWWWIAPQAPGWVLSNSRLPPCCVDLQKVQSPKFCHSSSSVAAAGTNVIFWGCQICCDLDTQFNSNRQQLILEFVILCSDLSFSDLCITRCTAAVVQPQGSVDSSWSLFTPAHNCRSLLQFQKDSCHQHHYRPSKQPIPNRQVYN